MLTPGRKPAARCLLDAAGWAAAGMERGVAYLARLLLEGRELLDGSMDVCLI